MQAVPDGVPVRAPDMPTERIIDRRRANERRQATERRKARRIELEAPVEQPVDPWPVDPWPTPRASGWNRVVMVSLGTFAFGVLLTMTIDRLTRHVRAEVVTRPIATAAPAPIVQPLPKPIEAPAPIAIAEPAPQATPAPQAAPTPPATPAPAATPALAAAPPTAIDLRPRRHPVVAKVAAPAPARPRPPTAPPKWTPETDGAALGTAPAKPAKPARAKWVDPFAE